MEECVIGIYSDTGILLVIMMLLMMGAGVEVHGIEEI